MFYSSPVVRETRPISPRTLQWKAILNLAMENLAYYDYVFGYKSRAEDWPLTEFLDEQASDKGSCTFANLMSQWPLSYHVRSPDDSIKQ
jgi:hypothetical protein